MKTNIPSAATQQGHKQNKGSEATGQQHRGKGKGVRRAYVLLREDEVAGVRGRQVNAGRAARAVGAKKGGE